MARLEGHDGWIVKIQFSESGRLVAAVCTDRTCRVWEVGPEGGVLVYTTAFTAFTPYIGLGRMAWGAGEELFLGSRVTIQRWRVGEDLQMLQNQGALPRLGPPGRRPGLGEL